MMLRLALILAVLAPAALAEAEHDRARDAFRRGEILPLSAILPEVQARHRARLLGLALKPWRGRMVYEFELITAAGRIVETRVDAASGVVIAADEDIDRDTNTVPAAAHAAPAGQSGDTGETREAQPTGGADSGGADSGGARERDRDRGGR